MQQANFYFDPCCLPNLAAFVMRVSALCRHNSLRQAFYNSDEGALSGASCSAMDDCLLASSACAVGSLNGRALLLLSKAHVRLRSQAHCA